MTKDFDKFPLVVNGKTVIFPCMEIMALSIIPKADEAAGYARFYEAFAKRYGDRLRYYQLSDSTKWKKVLPKDVHKVSGWFSDARSLAEPLLGITVHMHDIADEPRPPLFEMMFDHIYPDYPRGMFRIALPIDAVSRDATDVLDLVDDAMAEFPVHWGSAGYAFYWETNDTKIDNFANQWLGRHLAKHPGLSTGNLMEFGLFVEQGLASIGWLTFVGDALIEKLGGRQALEAASKSVGVGLRPYTKGVALQAGSVPELGNINRKQRLDRFHEVGRILEPIFATDRALENLSVDGFDDPDKELAWLKRFLP